MVFGNLARRNPKLKLGENEKSPLTLRFIPSSVKANCRERVFSFTAIALRSVHTRLSQNNRESPIMLALGQATSRRKPVRVTVARPES
jgi:hypothetical protein